MIYFIIAAAILAVDQLTKIIVRSSFELYESREVIPQVFHLTYIENPGAAFGLLADQRTFFLLITVFIIAFMIYFMKTLEKDEPKANLFLSMVIGGALGNFIDRFQKGAVTDFFDFLVWPVFNVADMFIVIGIVMAAFYIFKSEMTNKVSEADRNEV